MEIRLYFSVPVMLSRMGALLSAEASRKAEKPPWASIMERVKRSKSRPVISVTTLAISLFWAQMIWPLSASAISCRAAWSLPSGNFLARRWLQWQR